MENLLIDMLNGVASFFYKMIELTISIFTRQRRIKRVLSLKKARRTLILPLREGVINNTYKVKSYVFEEVEAITLY